VNNPLCGENGCSVVYGPQKGAAPMEIVQMDGWLKGFADLTTRWNPKADLNYPGAGAAGGLGFAFLAYTNSVLESGIQIIMEEIKLEEAIAQADLVITGEGRLDRQSVMGKAPVGVAKLAKKYGKKVIAFSGCVASGAEICNDHGIDAFFPILRTVCTLEEALNVENAYENLKATAYQVFKLL
jgi:glycerate kinase